MRRVGNGPGGGIARALARGVLFDAYFPFVSLAAFVSGSCFGYVAGRLLGRW